MPPEARAMMGNMGVQMGGNAQGMTTTTTQCITNQNPVPNAKTSENCQETHEMNGNTINFHVTCNGSDTQMDSTGQVTYNGDSMEGQVKSHQVEHGQSMDASIQITGRYLGSC